MSFYDDWGDPFDVYKEAYLAKKKNARTKQKPKRSTKYAGPGHTIVTYEHRTLHYRFKQSPEEYERAKKLRRKKAQKGRRTSQAVYVNKDGSYSSSRGRDVSDRVRRTTERGTSEIRHAQLKRDSYNIEDMRALLKDERWEEVCGHSRWKYDPNSTVKEYQRYLREHKGR